MKIRLTFIIIIVLINPFKQFYAQQKIITKPRSEKHLDFKELEKLTLKYIDNRILDTALIFAEKALIQAEKDFGKDTNYCNILTFLFEIAIDKGEYIKGINYCITERDLRKNLQGDKNGKYAIAIRNLAVLYERTGNYTTAESLHLECLNIQREVLNYKNRSYANTLNNLAVLYQTTGKYAAAESYYLESINIKKDVLGTKHQEYLRSINNLAILYLKVGNYSAAVQLQLEVLKIQKETSGANHPDYAIFLNNLSVSYMKMGKYAEAEQLYLEASKIQKTLLGPDHPVYATSIDNLAKLYKLQTKYTEAETLYLEALVIRKNVFGTKNYDYASTLNNLGQLYLAMNNYSKAEALFKESLEIESEVLGLRHPDYCTVLGNLAGLYCTRGSNDLAEPLMLKCINTVKGNIYQNFSFLSEKEKESYFNTWTNYFSSFFAFSLNRKKENKTITADVFNNVLSYKGLLLKSSTAMRTSILNNKDTSLIRQYNQWTNLKKEISKLNSTEISKRKKDPEVLEKQANDLEKELVKKSSALTDLNKLQNLTWLDIQKSLKKNEAVIEFLNFTEGKKNDTITYCALIITPESQFPEMISLFEEKELKTLLESYNGNNFNYVSGIYGDKKNPNSKLYELIWKPMEPYLKGIKNVYVSPSGLLHKISFAALTKKKGNYLSDEYNLNMVSSTGKVAMPENFVFDNSAVTSIYGGVNYNTDSTKKQIWKYLEGTKTESENISTTLKEKKLSVNYFSNNSASESEFKKSAVNSNIIHIATHGFFFPDPELELEEMRKRNSEKKDKNVVSKESTTVSEIAFRGGSDGFGIWSFVKNKNPLMRSGLVLAGANDVWNMKYKTGNEEDGVLTAAEVATLDLRKTGLVVLSACETGLGDIKGSEGVYGLQRAFKMAGVKYIIMSLWQVPDKETSEFMTTFYGKLLKVKDIKKAFSETQKEMRKKYDPYFWAAFVLVE